MTSYEKESEINVMMKEEVEELKRENAALKNSCKKYEEALKDLNDLVKNSPRELKREIEENKMVELRNEWKKEQEEEKIKFTEVVRRQIQEKTKDTVIQVIKEKEELVRDTVDKRKCLVIFGLREKKIPNKYAREKEERELARQVIQFVQDSAQGLDQEIEEIHRIGKYNEGGTRPLKVRMRSQVAVDEIMARTGKLAENDEYKDIWIKRDMNLEEREKERALRKEAKEKNEKRTEIEKKKFYWRILDMKLRKWYLREEKETTRGTQRAQEQEEGGVQV